MASSHRYRFTNHALPAHVLADPLAFARAMADRRMCDARLLSVWDRAGSALPVADRKALGGMTATVIRVEPYIVLHLAPPFPNDVGDACAIAVVGRGDGERELVDVRYHVLGLGTDTTTGATRLVMVTHTADGEPRTIVDDVPADLRGFLDRCLAVASGATPAPREQAPVVAPWYWWHLMRGADAMRAFCAAPEQDAWQVVNRCPILLLPEVVEAAELVLGSSRATEGLRQMHGSLHGTSYFAPFHMLLATTLAHERGGSPRVNLERALAVIAEVRRSGTDVVRIDACEARLRDQLAALGVDARRNYESALAFYELALARTSDPAERKDDERAMRAIRVALAAVAAPTAAITDPAWSSLFLEDELVGYQHSDEPLPPLAEDRAFAQRGGIASGSMIWLGNEALPVYRIVDTRWLFPSAKAATAFVQAIQPISGEGLASVTMTNVGDLAYGWGNTLPVRTPNTREVVVVRVGRMVAKLHVTEGPKAAQQFQTLEHSKVLPYVEAIVRRGRLALSRYWLAVARGVEAANRFVQTSPRGAAQLFAQYPILLLPEFPTAMASLGDAHGAAAKTLWTLQASFKNDWDAYRDVMRALVRALLDERAGQPVVNADAALALVVNHRRVDHDYTWAAIEAECRARA